ncbi:MAG: alpha/beta fold hydrolase, partial [Betaproteobacteria bacterium]|nr:alpha/beta fold hydrolase [Betaproteobacteria bacterium]
MTLHFMERIALEDDGPEGAADDPVFCVHGLGGSGNIWIPMMAALARHRVLRIDLPGSGLSQRAEGALSVSRFVDATLMACERLGIKRAHWLGHSLGTIVCQHLAVMAPERVSSLALFGPLLAPADAARQGLKARALKARHEGVTGMHSIALQTVQAALSRETRERNPLAVSFVRDALMRGDPEAYARSCEALAAAQPAYVDRITAPVLLVTGDEDAVAPPQGLRSLADRMQSSLNLRSVVLPRCGHWTTLERPDECGRAWTEFMGSVSRLPRRRSGTAVHR